MNQEQIHKFEVGISVLVAVALFGAVSNDNWGYLVGGFIGFFLGMYLGGQKAEDGTRKL